MKKSRYGIFLLVLTLAATLWGSAGAYAAGSDLRTVHLLQGLWRGDPGIPEEIRGTGYSFIVLTQEHIHGEDMVFLDYAGTQFTLKADGHPDVYAQVRGGFGVQGGTGFGLQVRDESRMAAGVPYSIVPPPAAGEYEWVAGGVTVTRNGASSGSGSSGNGSGTGGGNGGSEPKPAVLDHLEANERDLLLTSGQTSAIRIYAIMSDGKDKEITNDKKTVYRSDSASVAEVKGGTVKAGKREGTAVITVSYEGKKITIPVTVSKLKVAKLSANRKEVSLETDETEQVRLMATLSDGSMKDVTTLAVWMTDNSGAADVETGEIVGNRPGEAVITASYNGLSVEIPVEVTAAFWDESDLLEVVGLEASNKNIRMKIGQEKILQIFAVYDDGSKEEITDQVLWQTSKSDVADIDNGVIAAEGSGKAVITANYRTQSLQISVQVEKEKPIKSLSVSSKKVTMKIGSEKQLALTAVYTDGSKADVTENAEWVTKNGEIVDAEAGLFVANGKGTAIVTVKYNGKFVNIVVQVK